MWVCMTRYQGKGCLYCYHTRTHTQTSHFPKQSGIEWSEATESRAERNRRTVYFPLFLLSSTGHHLNMQQEKSVDPTKMGVGRAIAVLTSGGDAQGEKVYLFFMLVYTALYFIHCLWPLYCLLN